MCLVRDIGCKRILKGWCQLCHPFLEMSLNPQDQKNKGQKSDLKLWHKQSCCGARMSQCPESESEGHIANLHGSQVSCGILRTGNLRTSQGSVLGMDIVDSHSESLQQWDSFNQSPGQWWRHLNGGEGGKHHMRFHDRMASRHRWGSLWWLTETNTLSKFIVWK